MNQIKVSVIVPVYNAQQYLKDTLDTIIGQSLKSIEIICVDDGSSDESLSILKDYQNKDSRLIVLTQQNQYAGVARNNGLNIARGKYVVFWDADDLFEKNALECMYKKCEKDQADLCVCAANRYDSLTQTIIKTGTYLKKEMLPDHIPFSKKTHPRYIFNFSTNVPWNKMWKRSFIEKHHLRFQNLKQANDTYFSMMSYFLAECITIVDKPLMNYRINNTQSLTGKASSTVFCSYQAYYQVYEDLKNDIHFTKEIKQSFDNRLINGMLYSLKTQSMVQSFMKIYIKLQQSLIHDFQISQQLNQDYFYVKKDYQDFKDVMTLTPHQFLLTQYQMTNRHIYTRGHGFLYHIYYALYYSRIWKLCMKLKENLKKL